MKIKRMSAVGILSVVLCGSIPALIHATEPTSAPSTAEETVLPEATQVPLSCEAALQPVAVDQVGIGCITCGTDEWCDQWCGPDQGRCAQNLECGPFYKKYCHCPTAEV